MVLPTAAAFEHPERIGDVAEQHFAPLGVSTRTLPVLNRRDAEDAGATCKAVEAAKFVYLADGSPMHLRSVLKGSALYEAMLAAFRGGAVSPRPAPPPRCCATRWSTRAAVRTRWASGSWRGSRCSRTTAPRPTICSRGRSTSSRRRRSSSVSTPRPRSCASRDRRGRSPAPGVVTIYGDDGPTPYAAGAERHRPAVTGQVVLDVAALVVVEVATVRRRRASCRRP